MKLIVLLGRILFSAIFILAALGHFSSQTIAYAAAHGIPQAGILVPLSGIVALLGGLSVLFGYKAKIGAWLLVIFLVPITLCMHKFWQIADPMQAGMQEAMFIKNLAILGGALLITHFGSGPLSLDTKVHHKKPTKKKR